MIDIRAFRENPEPARILWRIHGGGVKPVDCILEADAFRRASFQKLGSLRTFQREILKSVGKASKEERPAILVKVRELTRQVKVLETHTNGAGTETDRLTHLLPNLVLDGAPAGGKENFVVLCHEDPAIGDFATEDFESAGHLAIGEGLDTIDTKRGAEISNVHFCYLRGIGARLELVLMTTALDQALAADFVPMMTPILVTPQVMSDTGFLSEHSEEIHYLPANDLCLTGTFEIALTGYHSDETLDLSVGPKRYLSWSTYHHREADPASEDTRGIIYVYQLSKTEMFSCCRPEETTEEHERPLAREEGVLRKVELSYRVTDTAAGDLGASTVRKFDCETRLFIQSRYIEATSTSNCATFRAHRLSVRKRREDGMSPVVTLSGALAATR